MTLMFVFLKHNGSKERKRKNQNELVDERKRNCRSIKLPRPPTSIGKYTTHLFSLQAHLGGNVYY